MKKLILIFYCICWGESVYGAALPPSPYDALYKKITRLEIVKLYPEIEKLTAEYEAARARETSTANKLLTAATMAATGVGGMQLASGLAEQRADENAELDMTAYLNTFTCRYGDGKSVRGGDANIELPISSQMVQLVSEYKTLAADLKSRKAALGMAPGIESDVILDSATAGLYDNESLERADGVYTSLSRALTDENSADAAEWNTQKEESAQKTKTGAIVGGIGLVGGAVGDMIINQDKDDKE